MPTLVVSRSLTPLRADARSIPDGFAVGCKATTGAAGGGGGGGGGGAEPGVVASDGAERLGLHLLVAELFSGIEEALAARSGVDKDGG